MFDLKAFIVTNIVNGIKNGTFTKEYGNIMAVNYLAKGMLTEENVIDIATQIEVWENPVEEPVEPEEPAEEQEETPVEEPVETPTETAETE